MGEVVGFNVGSLISLGDMEKVIDYIGENESESSSKKFKDTNGITDFSILPFQINKNVYTDDQEYSEDNALEADITEDDFEDFIEDDDYEDEDYQEFSDDDFDDFIDDDEVEEENEPVIKNIEIEVKSQVKSTVSVEKDIKDSKLTEYEKEIALLKSKLAEKEKQKEGEENNKREELERKIKIQKLIEEKKRRLLNSRNNLVKNTATKVDSIKKETISTFNIYDTMEIDSIYKEVRRFMVGSGVNISIISVDELYEKFGKHNIKRLVEKSYLIQIGRGVTIGK